MRAFLLGALAALLLAGASGFVLEGWFSEDADARFASPSARVGSEPSAEARRFSG
jgi:hypothetical protein